MQAKLFAHLRCTKVCDLDHAIMGYEQVCPLEVPVNDELVMKVRKTLERLVGVTANRRLRKCPGLLKYAADGAPRGILQKYGRVSSAVL